MTLTAFNTHTLEYGQSAEGNDFHRREDDERRTNAHIAREPQRKLNIMEWNRRIHESVLYGDHETAKNIRAFLAAGYD